MKFLHQGSVILFLILIVSFIGIQPVGATKGGSFEIPSVNDDFNQVKPGPAPAKEISVSETKQEKGFFDKVRDFFSSTWEKGKSGIKKASDWIVSKAKGVWNWVTSKTGKVAGAIALGAAAISAIFRKYGQQIKSGVQSAYSGAKQWVKNLLGIRYDYPHGTIHTIDTTDKELAHAADLTYLDVISERNIKTTLGEEWVEEEDLYLDLPNGLQAHVFVNDHTNEMIIAFRGTEPKWEDIVIGDGPIAFGNDRINLQAIEARKYVEKILNNPDYRDYEKVLTGHSLGGYLAADCAIKYRVPAITFNAPGKNLFPNVNVTTLAGAVRGAGGGPVGVVGGAVGSTAAGYVENMLDPQLRAEEANEKAGTYDKLIRNYRYDDDLVGSLGYRPGKTYDIESDGRVEKDEGLDNQLGFGIKSHGISNFTSYDREKGEYVDVDSPIPDLYGENGNIVER
ncbi:DUF2974 domain-containing protein [Thermoactinomyces intermedius]|uniref:DUF2974 domain-containing protein n=1 Tax=Thermoactinomyces intermedius TaxID=2024 RepID=A0A8I1AAX3_THEIN|nr:DUF2974 domain-containing protein [Thermoactinomyces intermedius]MBA4549926.1 DUF2974 domain-containing protein [Thermoactinomyces intermedius]MBA4835648.1 DUF2974 domain-containing protein [Thermoactinomyces intermedius]MBH8596255.1 DUF2974 domain-containing protein [Thermoactinomyces intermedius]